MTNTYREKLIAQARAYAKAVQQKDASGVSKELSNLDAERKVAAGSLQMAERMRNQADLEFAEYRVKLDKARIAISEAEKELRRVKEAWREALDDMNQAAVDGDDDALASAAEDFVNGQERADELSRTIHDNRQFILDSDEYARVSNARRKAVRTVGAVKSKIKKLNEKQEPLDAKLKQEDQLITFEGGKLVSAARTFVLHS